MESRGQPPPAGGAALPIAAALTAGAAALSAASGADRLIARLVHQHVTGGWHALFKGVSALGDATGYVLTTLVALAVLRLARRRPGRDTERLRGYARYGHLLLASLALSGLAVGVLKPLVGRLRPKFLLREDLYGLQPLNFDFAMVGFPSGHAQTVWVTASVAVLLLARLRAELAAPGRPGALGWARLTSALAWAALAGASLVSLSRVLVNAHFVSDVLAGALLGVLATVWLAPRILGAPLPARTHAPARTRQPRAASRPLQGKSPLAFEDDAPGA
jgi:membrane-associated phospholipid phosphatase